MKKLEQSIQDILDHKLSFDKVLEVIKELKPLEEDNFMDLGGDKVFMVLMGSDYDDEFEVLQKNEPTLIIKCSSENIAVFVTFCKNNNYFLEDVNIIDNVVVVDLKQNLEYLQECYEDDNFKDDFETWGYNSTERCFVKNITKPWNKGH